MDRDIENDNGALEEFRELGFYSLPVTVIADKTILGFRPNEIMEALHRTINTFTRDPSETIPIIERALEAVVSVVRQMPDEKLDWAAPQRKRSMREFTQHIFVHALSLMVERINDVQAWPEVKMDSHADFQSIADYGKTVITKFRTWAQLQDLDALRETTGMALKTSTGAEQLELAAGQIIQHLRQLYSILDTFGIKPENRVHDSEWPEEYVLRILW